MAAPAGSGMVVVSDLASTPRIFLLGTQLTLFSREQLLDYILRAANEGLQVTILSGNIHSYNLACKYPWLQQFMNHVEIVRLDGAGVRLGARILGYDTPERMTWADFGWALAHMAETNRLKMFFLGGRPGIAKKAAEELSHSFPAILDIVCHHGYFDKDPMSSESGDVLRFIEAARPDILIVGMGMPVQEQWLSEVRHQLGVPVVMTGGAVFDYLSGEQRRGPEWMTDHGLEWFARLMIEPRRLWKRYIIGNPLFLIRILMQRLGWLGRHRSD